jgi:SAM-dependent methyltransferase
MSSTQYGRTVDVMGISHRSEPQQGHGHGHGHGHDVAIDESGLGDLLDLDGEVLQDHLSEVTRWIDSLLAEPPRRILDVGAGTGTGTFALLDRFDAADAIAVDASAQFLHRLEARASAAGLADRVHTVEADLDVAWPAVEGVDLVWASASMHHMADPDRVLSQIFAVLPPGGLFVVVELDSFPRFLPDDVGIGRPGLEERGHEVMAERRAAALPEIGSDWGSRLTQAGFTIEAERLFAIELTAPLPAATARYAQVSLGRMRASLDGRLDADDLATLDILLDSTGPEGVLQRDDLSVRAARTVWAARRP